MHHESDSRPAGARAVGILTGVAVALELASTVGLWTHLGVLGVVLVRPSTVPALLLLAVLGPRIAAGARRWVVSSAVAGAVIALEALRSPQAYGGTRGLAGLALGALQEEVVFRGALPVTAWVLLERAGVPAAVTRLVTLFSAAGLFALQPHHLRQGALPFFLFAVLFCLCIRGPEALVPAALAHLAFNLLSLGGQSGVTGPFTRVVGSCLVLGAFVATALADSGPSGRRARGAPDPEPDGLAGWTPALST